MKSALRLSLVGFILQKLMIGSCLAWRDRHYQHCSVKWRAPVPVAFSSYATPAATLHLTLQASNAEVIPYVVYCNTVNPLPWTTTHLPASLLISVAPHLRSGVQAAVQDQPSGYID